MGSLIGGAGGADAAAAIPLAELAALDDGGLSEVAVHVDGVEESLVLHRRGDVVQAWRNVCPHAGRRLDWAPGQFLKSREGHLVCAAHGAAFGLADGVCVAGPCRGDALHAVPVEVREGRVWLVPAG